MKSASRKSRQSPNRNPQERRILLTGMPGAGKSTTGRVLARLLSCPFIDLDDAFEERFGETPARAIRSGGEALFRKRERMLLGEFLDGGTGVLACGGGTLADVRSTRKALERAWVVWLEAPPEVLADRLGGVDRHPLLAERVRRRGEGPAESGPGGAWDEKAAPAAGGDGRRARGSRRTGRVSRQALESALSGLLEERRGFYSKAHMTVDTRRKSPFQVAMDVARQVGADGPGQVCADGPGQVCADGPGQVGAGGPGQVGADGPGQAVAARIAGFGDVNGGREGILPLGERSYPVRISQLAGFSGLGGFLDEVLPTSDRFVLVDEQVLGLYEQSLRRALQPGPVRFIPLPSGEEAKSLSRTEECLERLLLAGATRSSAVVAVGGGSALDAAGFAASIYMRSIPVVYVPTTLLAAVDAGIGGKNGVNLRQGKNMAGTIFQPRGVFVPLRVVEKEVETRGGHDGAAELLKICLIAGEPFDRIRTLARRGGRIRASRLAEAVELAAACKMAIVSRDERDDKGERVVLNLGHTFAHMAETASRYRVSHGRAVAWGLVVAARVSVGLGMVPAGFETRVEELCRHFGLWPPPMALPVELLQGPLLDKKRVGGTLPLVLFGKAGRPVVTRFGVEEAGKLLLSGMSPILVPGA